MDHRKIVLLGLCLLLFPSGLVSAGETAVPAGWLPAWNTPALADRPLQIVHGHVPLARANPEGMEYYLQRGLGGLVLNVGSKDYLEDAAEWDKVEKLVEACVERGMVAWIYDEDGYPSGAAGGRVLEVNPRFEAQELIYAPGGDPPFAVRAAYEHSHAANNFYAARRCPNLIDAEAMKTFIGVTHERYWKRLEPHFGKTIQAFFTDEPSLMAVNLGQLPEEVRKRVHVQDPVDPAVKDYPSVPWSDDLAAEYQRRYGEDLLERRRDLFEGDSEAAKRTRRRYWSLISDLMAERFFGPIQNWCRPKGVASSGHSLWEERIIHHVPLYGNALESLKRMDWPGLDMLSSNPGDVIHVGWLTAGLPSSAAVLGGNRRAMTEVSDFIQKMGGQGPASVEKMQATAAWQACWGVTEFTLYYGPEDRPPEQTKAYGDFVGRLNSLLKGAKIERRVLLYYPIRDLWEEYRPVAGPIKDEEQTPRARALAASFLRDGQLLQRNQIPFNLVDHETLEDMTLGDDGALETAGHAFEVLLLPEGVVPPESVSEKLKAFETQGGLVVRGPWSVENPADQIRRAAGLPYRITPARETVCLGHFSRDGRDILVLANVSETAYEGVLAGIPEASAVSLLNPTDGGIAGAEPTEGGIRLELPPHETRIVVSSSK